MALKSNYVELEECTSTSSYGAVSYVIHNFVCLLGTACVMFTRGWTNLSRVELIGNKFGANTSQLQESYGNILYIPLQ